MSFNPPTHTRRLAPSILSVRYWLVIFAVLMLALGTACGTDEPGLPSGGASDPGRPSPIGELTSAPVSGMAPGFSVETFHHGTYSLDQRVGTPVLINFWFPSCPPCRAEMPDLQAAYETYGGEIDFIGVQQVSLDSAREGIAFLDELGVTYPNFADEDLKVQISYEILSFPTTIFLNRDHSISRTWTGVIGEEQLAEQIEAVINS